MAAKPESASLMDITSRVAQAAVRAVAQRNETARYIRDGLKLAGYSQELADLADFMRGDRDALDLDMLQPGDRQAAEWFVALLADQQRNIRFVLKYEKLCQ
jgi:hypothetical protein